MRLLRLILACAMSLLAVAPPAGAWEASGSTTLPDGTTVSVEKQADGSRVKTTTSPDGRVTRETVDDAPTKTPKREKETSGSTKDEHGNTVTYKKNPDGTTTKTVTAPDGTELDSDVLQPEAPTKTTKREPGTSGSTKDADGNTVSLKKNADGTWTKTVTDPQGNVIATKTTDQYGNPVDAQDTDDDDSDAPAAAEPTGDRMVFQEVKKGPVTAHVGMVSTFEGATALLIVSMLVLGPKGPSARTWMVRSMILQTALGQLRAIRTEPYWVAKDALALSTIAALVFAVVGTQYALASQMAMKRQGEVCPVTGQKMGEDKGRFAKEVERQGMAGTMALLTSQAKGEVTGMKATFDVTELINQRKVPSLGEIAVLAHLFNARDEARPNPSEQKEVKLMVMVTPTLIRLDDAE